jgi:hypothetical protein
MFSLSAVLPGRINDKAYVRANQAFIFEAIQAAGRAFIFAAWSSPIPVRSGMSRGSLMADVQAYQGSGPALSFFNTSVPISPSEYDKRYYIQPEQRNLGGISYTRHEGTRDYKSRGWLPKTPETGAMLSKYVIKKATDKKLKISFVFDSGVLHYNYNEFLLEWRSLERGANAFNESIVRSFQTGLPDLKDYMEYVRVSGGRKTNIQGWQTNRKVIL